MHFSIFLYVKPTLIYKIYEKRRKEVDKNETGPKDRS